MTPAVSRGAVLVGPTGSVWTVRHVHSTPGRTPVYTLRSRAGATRRVYGEEIRAYRHAEEARP